MVNLLELEIELFKDRAFDFLNLTDKQTEALNILTDSVTEELTFGGAAGGGKSWLGCEWLYNMCLSYPGTRWFIAREELKRIKSTTLLTFYKVCNARGIKTDEVFIYKAVDHYIQFHNGSRIDLLEVKYLPSDPLFERYGSEEFTGGWIEEGGEVDFGAYEVLNSRIGRHLNEKFGLMPKLLITCNPKKNWMYQYFYKPFVNGVLEAGKRFLQSLITDNPKIDSGYIQKLQNLKDKKQKARLLLGQWEYEDDPSQLMTYDKITDVFTNSFVEPGKPFITADIARLGDDKTRVVIWNGWRAEKIISYEKQLINVTADRIRELMNQYKVPKSSVLVDEDGVGGGVVDILGCKGFVNNSRALNNENYDNLKSQCYFRFSDRVNDSKVFIVVNESEKEAIIEEMEQVKKKDIDKDGKQGIVPKDKVKAVLGRSPDYSDAFMMREYFELNQYKGTYTIL